MKYLYAIIIGCALATSWSYGQEMTLGQCIKLGIDNNLSLANAHIGIDKARVNISQNRAKLLPIISGALQLTDYLKSPVNVTTGTLLGNDFPDNPTWQAIKTMQYNATMGVSLSMPLYDQQTRASITVAETLHKILSLSYDKAAQDLTVQIARLYYMAQASLEQTRLADENISRMKQLCNITEALYTQGVIMEVDLNRVRINLDNLESLHNQSLTLHNQQLNLLRFLLDMSPDTPLEVTPIDKKIAPLHPTGLSTSLPSLLVSAQQQTMAEQQIKAVKASYLPTVSLVGYAGAMGYQEKIGHYFHTSSATDNWFANCHIGLSLRVPLFDANIRKLQIRQLRHNAQQASNNARQTQRQLQQEYANALLQLNHNTQQFETQSHNQRQAQEVYNLTIEQYKEGVASMTSLLQDEMQLRTAQTSCVQALCQCRLAQLELLRLTGALSKLSQQP